MAASRRANSSRNSANTFSTSTGKRIWLFWGQFNSEYTDQGIPTKAADYAAFAIAAFFRAAFFGFRTLIAIL
ncbi:MAG: hypothetical protein ACLQVN_04915 [Bryobacteraceae bacterium]